ncbi:hypothetical protein M3P21_08945 [Ruegeria sp. 2012CJ41-6]|uniref:D-alanyl-D-alanine dipeptidase n=1 Tax=Ruegeria spongiae TaxID=2942209 RepID=A0ABT0Q1G1_9RHOB|nr:M15 family metallopeptidase [Ruegeria spongiae]MCL6283656.1 hypothetical protein [Ruegeria spongiae]
MNITDLQPIPICSNGQDARGYHDIAFDKSDPRALERLVDVGAHGIAVVPYYHLSDGSNPPYGRRIDGSLPRMWCRESLVPMLRSANDALAACGCELVVYDAYRPITTQHGLWEWALAKVAADHPALPRSELEALTSQYSSDPRRFDPVDATTWPTHSTGASVDVVLRALDTDEVLDMGAGFDELSAVAHTDHLERERVAGRIGPENAALLNRRLLYWAMTNAGFANYPSEYWHFDFGNQMYIHNTRTEHGPQDRAWYGYCRLCDGV